MANLLTGLQALEAEQPDLPDSVKSLLSEAEGDIHSALQREEAASIQNSLLQAVGGLMEQIQTYQDQIKLVSEEEETVAKLLESGKEDGDKNEAKLLQEVERAEILKGEREIIEPLYEQALIEIGYAKQAEQYSQELSKSSWEAIEKIIAQRIAQRIEERKAGKKGFFSKLLGIVSQVVGIISIVLKFTPLAPLGVALFAASAGIGASRVTRNCYSSWSYKATRTT